MPTFVWEAKTRSGDTKTGEMDADSADIVTQRLRAQSLQVNKVKKKPAQINIKLPGSSGPDLDHHRPASQRGVPASTGSPLLGAGSGGGLWQRLRRRE